MIWPNVPRPTAGMVAPVLSLKEVGADMTDKLEEVGGSYEVGPRDGLSILRLSDNTKSTASARPGSPGPGVIFTHTHLI